MENLQAACLTSAALDEDVPCPRCDYNLRGLTVPRCPECGYLFEWRDIPRMRPGQSSSDVNASFATSFIAVGLGALFLIGFPYSLAVLVPIAACFGVSFLQALLEVACASCVLHAMTWPRFRAWWEGVLIGYGACGVFLLASGWTMSVFESFGSYSEWPRGFAPCFWGGAALALVIQWAVVRYRLRRRGEAVPERSLLLACAVGKAAAELCWLLLPVAIIRA